MKEKICCICNHPAKLWRSIPPIGICCHNTYAAKQAIERHRGVFEHKGLVQTESGETAKPFKVNRPKSLTADQKEDKKAMDEFFEVQAEQVPGRCDNCKRYLMAYSDWAKRCVTAHILPKALFPSVATHPLNRVFLGVPFFSDCSCHPIWDNSDAATRKQMPVYSQAIERVEQFYCLLTPHEQNKCDDYLGTKILNFI